MHVIRSQANQKKKKIVTKIYYFIWKLHVMAITSTRPALDVSNFFFNTKTNFKKYFFYLFVGKENEIAMRGKVDGIKNSCLETENK